MTDDDNKKKEKPTPPPTEILKEGADQENRLRLKLKKVIKTQDPHKQVKAQKGKLTIILMPGLMGLLQ